MKEESPFYNDYIRIAAAWSSVKPLLLADPSILERTIPGIAIEQVEEAMGTIWTWAERVRAPSGFRPLYPISRLQLGVAIKGIATHSANLAADPETHLATFITRLISCFPPLTAAMLFSDKNDKAKATIEAHGELEQHIALMHTAQAELGTKLSRLSDIEAVAGKIERFEETIGSIETRASASASEVDSLLEKAKEDLEEISSTKAESEDLKSQVEALISANENLKSMLSKQSSEFSNFVTSSKDRLEILKKDAETQKQLIDSLLSGATSSALATAFNRGKKRYTVGQWIWGLGFFASVITLLTLGLRIENNLVPGSTAGEIWLYLAHRIPFAAPLIWLGWFCAIQYGNVLRLMEDYAFKEATSIAFAGYRDHMEHLSGVADGDSSNALERLAVVTISILGNEPLRLLQKQHQDASPANKLLDLSPFRKKDISPSE